MGAETSIDYASSFDCHVCLRPDFAKKDGPGCVTCPAFANTHYFPRPDGDVVADLLCVGDVPEVPSLALLQRNSGDESFFHQAFTDDGGKVVRSAVAELQGAAGSPYRGIKVRYVYAVKCAAENPNKSTIEHCQTPLNHEVSRVVAARRASGKTAPLVILATGVAALRGLGISVQSFEKDAAGRVFTVDIGTVPVVVVATMSLKAMAAQAGKAGSIVSDVRRAFDHVRGQAVKPLTREQIEADYVYPRTVEAVRELVDHILAYTENGVDPNEWYIAVDTETNTLHPHRDGTRLLTVPVAWAEGKATSFALWHPALHGRTTGEGEDAVVEPPWVDAGYTPEAAWVHVKRLIESNKPKIGHNIAKYDRKVFWKYGCEIGNLRWDGLLAEHAIEEDKKGQYSLKYLTKQFIPEFSGYEDKLHEYLDKEEGEDQGASIRKHVTVVDLPKPVLDALERTGLTPKFQAGSLEKQLERERARLAQREAIDETRAFLTRNGFVEPFVFKTEWKALVAKAAEIKARGPLLFVEAQDFTDAEIAIIDRLNGLDAEARRWLTRPVSETFIFDAELLLAAKRAGEFTKKVEKKVEKKEQEGGFERVPLAELSFYGAVDADVTRRIAMIQRRRMRDEDLAIAERRRRVGKDLSHARGIDRRYKVDVLCTTQAPLLDLHRNRYLPRAQVLSDMEFRGVRIDRAYLEESRTELDNVLNRTETKLYAMAGEPFNVNSGAQLGNFLFDTGQGFIHPDPEAATKIVENPDYADKVQYENGRMRYAFVSKTTRGQVQVNEKTFRTYLTNYDCPFSDLILLYKKATKARDTFLKNIELLSSLDGYIHANFNQNGTSTGRLSSSNINLQNTPKGFLGAIVDKKGKLVLGTNGKPVGPGVNCKRLFLPDDDSFCLVNADAKGAEVGVFSGYSKDAGLIAALCSGLDAHCYFSAKTLDPAKIGAGLHGEARRVALASAGIDDEHGWTYDDFYKGKDGLLADDSYNKRLKKLRDNIKRVVFGILFGAGPRKIAEIAGITEALAKTIITALFDEFKSIPAFIEQTKWELRTFGFVETYHGRRRRFHWDPRSAPRKMLAKAERQAVNFKIQGTNSDIVLDVLVAVNDVLRRDLGGRMLMTVHDSLVFQIPKKYAHQVKDLMADLGTRRVARDCPWLPVPFKWDIEMGPSYGKLQSFNDYVKSLPVVTTVVGSQSFLEEEALEELREEAWKADDHEVKEPAVAE